MGFEGAYYWHQKKKNLHNVLKHTGRFEWSVFDIQNFWWRTENLWKCVCVVGVSTSVAASVHAVRCESTGSARSAWWCWQTVICVSQPRLILDYTKEPQLNIYSLRAIFTNHLQKRAKLQLAAQNPIFPSYSLTCSERLVQEAVKSSMSDLDPDSRSSRTKSVGILPFRQVM